ncbi:hypothetical protein DFH27DRAFT_603266 [Peziza echinospora]|nr:hypothetical protein DFH27DRAFT_603266 [Peziza echinospora]
MVSTTPQTAGPGRAKILTAVDISLESLDESEVTEFVGIDGENLQSLAEKTNTNLFFHTGTPTVTIRGSYQHVRQCHRALNRLIQDVKLDRAFQHSSFHVFDHRFWPGMVLHKDNPGSFVLGISPSIVSSPDECFSEVDQVRVVSEEILKKITLISSNKRLAANIKFTLGKCTFTQSCTSDLKLDEIELSPSELRKLLAAETLSYNFDVVHNAAKMITLKSILLEEGFTLAPEETVKIYISHREEIDGKVSDVLWVAKPVKCIEEDGIKVSSGMLELSKIKINDAYSCLATFHSPENVLEAHSELIVYQVETEEGFASVRERFERNFRHRETGESIIVSKEALKDSSARRRISTKFYKDGICVALDSIKESRSVTSWEVNVKSKELSNIIKAGVEGSGITGTDVQLAMEKCLTTIDTIKSKLIRMNLWPGIPTSQSASSTVDSGTSLSESDDDAETLQARPFSNQPETQSINNWFSNEAFPEFPAMNSFSLQAKKDISSYTYQDIFAASKKIGIQAPFKAKASVENCPPTRPMVNTALSIGAIAPPSLVHVEDMPHQSSTFDHAKMNGKIPPPNTPATQSGAGSPIATPRRCSRAGSIVAGIENDGLCGISYTPIPLTKLATRKNTVDLLGSIDELLFGNHGQENEVDEDLICLSPKQRGFELMGEDMDLLLI